MQPNTIDVALVTWPKMEHRRTGFAECVDRLQRLLSASRHAIRYFCSSEIGDVDASGQNWLNEFCHQHGIDLSWRKAEPNLGANMNAALKLCTGSHLLLVQDDMFLQRSLDASMHAEFLDQHREYLFVRFDSTYTTFNGPIDGTDLLDVNMQGRYSYQDEPSLRRADFVDSIGFYLENGPHGSASQSYNRYLNRRPGQWKIARTEPSYFKHGGVKSSMPERW